jgi:hypothetical protein
MYGLGGADLIDSYKCVNGTCLSTCVPNYMVSQSPCENLSYTLPVLNLVEIKLRHLVTLQLASLLCQCINFHKEQVY